MKIVLAILGQTKFGKSTLLALLSNIFIRFLRIFSKTGGRTKTLTEYWFDKDNENTDIWITDIDVLWIECLGSLPGDVETYNENLKKKPALATGLGLTTLQVGDKPRDYVEGCLRELKNRPVTDIEIEKLLCTEELDKCISKITFRVPANNIIKKFAEKTGIELRIRDTKGLLDLSMEEASETTKKRAASLSEIGLSKIDGAIFGCEDTYPNMVQTIYADTLRGVFKSVPTYLCAKDKRMFRSFDKRDGFNEEDVEELIDSIQDGSNFDYEDTDDAYFRETYRLFADPRIGVMKKTDNGNYEYADTYFEKGKTQFIIPISSSLRKFSTGDLSEEDLSNAKDLIFLQEVVSLSVVKMVELIFDFHKDIEKLHTDGIAKNFMKAAAQKVKGDLMADFAKYDNASHGADSTKYCRPMLSYTTGEKLQNNIDDMTVDILGPRRGITTYSNGKLKFYTAAVVAVSARRWLDAIIGAVEVDTDIRDSAGNIIFSGLAGNYERQTQLVKSVLLNDLYSRFTDMDATIQNHLSVDRNKAEFGITERRNAPTLQSAFEQTIQIIVSDFCRNLN